MVYKWKHIHVKNIFESENHGKIDYFLSLYRALHISIPGFCFILKLFTNKITNFMVLAAKFQTKEDHYNIPFFLLQSETYFLYEIPRQVSVWAMYSNYRVSMCASCFVLGLKYKINEKVNDPFVLILIKRSYLVFFITKVPITIFCHNLCLQKSLADAWNTKGMIFFPFFLLFIMYVIILYIKFSSWINPLDI